jgi:hypothetical protein
VSSILVTYSTANPQVINLGVFGSSLISGAECSFSALALSLVFLS